MPRRRTYALVKGFTRPSHPLTFTDTTGTPYDAFQSGGGRFFLCARSLTPLARRNRVSRGPARVDGVRRASRRSVIASA